MKHIHMHIPSSIGISTIILFAILATIFIYLSMSAFEYDVERENQTVPTPKNRFTQWFQKDGTAPYADVIFKYDQAQKDKMIINNYEMSPVAAPEKITNNEISTLLDCFRDNNCNNKKNTQRVQNIINSYSHSVITDNLVAIYGVTPNSDNKNKWHIDSHILLVSDNVFVDIINPIESKLNRKYAKRITNGEEVATIESDLWNEILAEQSPEIVADLSVLERSARSVQIVPREE